MLLLSVPTNRLVVPALPVSFYSMEEKPRLRCLFSLCQKASTGTFCAVPVGSRGRLVLLPYPVAEALLSTSRRHRRVYAVNVSSPSGTEWEMHEQEGTTGAVGESLLMKHVKRAVQRKSPWWEGREERKKTPLAWYRQGC